jgi:hypothetical protein
MLIVAWLGIGAACSSHSVAGPPAPARSCVDDGSNFSPIDSHTPVRRSLTSVKNAALAFLRLHQDRSVKVLLLRAKGDGPHSFFWAGRLDWDLSYSTQGLQTPADLGPNVKTVSVDFAADGKGNVPDMVGYC